MDFFDYLAAAADDEPAAVRIQHARAALRQARQNGLLTDSPQLRWLRALLRFCDFDSLATWLEERPRTLRRIATFAQRQGHDQVAALIGAALERAADTPIESIELSDLETALSLALDGFEQTVLQLLLDSRGQFELPLPRTLRRRYPEVG